MNINAYAVDNVNNKIFASQTKKKRTLAYMDMTGPNLNFSYNGPNLILRDTSFISKNTKISLFGNDTESGFKNIVYSIDDDSSKTYEGPFFIDKEGFHYIDFMGFDNVLNSNNLSFNIFVDTSGPDIFPRFSVVSYQNKTVDGKNINIYPNSVICFVASTDKYVGYDRMYYSIDGEGERLFEGLIRNFSKNRDYNINIRALDKLGNQTTALIQFATEN